MNIAFAGTPEFAVNALRALHAAGHNIALVLTKPDQPGRRGMGLQSAPVKRAAQELGLDLIQPRSLRLDGKYPQDAADARARLAQAKPKAWVVAAYGLMLPAWALDLPEHGCLNIHASLLPRWRGAAPIQRAIEAGDQQSGVAIMRMEEGLDTGPVLMSSSLELRPNHTSGQLERDLAAMGASLVIQALAQVEGGVSHAQAQPEEGACYAKKIDKSQSRIDWSESARQIERRARAFDPSPGVWSLMRGEAVKLSECSAEPGEHGKPGVVLSAGAGGLLVSCGAGALRIMRMQRPGGKAMDAASCLSGFKLDPGESLG
jgi:methionyl-tRNA formyltransferase